MVTYIWNQHIRFLCNDKDILFDLDVGKVSSHRLSSCNSLLFTFWVLRKSNACVKVPVQIFFFWCKTFCYCLFLLM